MKLLAISDRYIPDRFMKDGLAALSEYDIETEPQIVGFTMERTSNSATCPIRKRVV